MLIEKIENIITLQLNDNGKARIIDKKQLNEYRINNSENINPSQVETYNYLNEEENK